MGNYLSDSSDDGELFEFDDSSDSDSAHFFLDFDDFEHDLRNSMYPALSNDGIRRKMPVIRRRESISKLRHSSVYQDIKISSGCTNSLSDSSLIHMLNKRQFGNPFTSHERCKVHNIYLPNTSKELHDIQMKIFNGIHSNNGKYFLMTTQDHNIKLFNASNDKYKHISTLQARDIRWSILDIAFSPNDDYYVYSSWAERLYLSSTTNTHFFDVRPLHLGSTYSKFCAFCVTFAPNTDNIVAGSNEGSVIFFNTQLGKVTNRITDASLDTSDVNAVKFIDNSSNVFVTGSDNSYINVWDARCLNDRHTVPIGVFIGHRDGITHIDSKNDGRSIISNSKDQSIKLWDLRKVSTRSVITFENYTLNNCLWDYRWDSVPSNFYNPAKPMKEDTSIMTYRGHRVRKTLIRARFSPLESTGQRYIYTGCSTGRIIIYDVLTGDVVRAIPAHNEIVRDVSWHPHRSEILSSSWNYKLNINYYEHSDKPMKVIKNVRGPLRRSLRLAMKRKAERMHSGN